MEEEKVLDSLEICLDIIDGTKNCEACAFNGETACTCSLLQAVIALINEKKATADKYQRKYMRMHFTYLSLEHKIEGLLLDLRKETVGDY